MMVGRKLEAQYPRLKLPRGEKCLQVKHLSGSGVNDASLTLYRGEILGVAGLMGAGRTELMKIIYGAVPRKAGSATLVGHEVIAHSPQDGLENGIVYISEDRKRDGLVLGMSVKENMSLTALRYFSRAGGSLKQADEQQAVSDFIRLFNIKTPSMEQSIGLLSGGNQQKVAIARGLMTRPKVLILDEPTRGVDVGAKKEIYKLINQFKQEGLSIILVSSCVGTDDIGERIRQQLVTDRIDTQPIEAIADSITGVALIFVNAEGENVIGIDAGANAAVTPDYLARYQQQVIDADALLLQLESPLETVIAAARLAKQHQTQVILNPAPTRELPDELLAMIDIITPNETEAQRLTGIAVDSDEDVTRAAQALHGKGICTVIITLGSRGVWLSENGKLIPGFKVKVVDTIAAGDIFNGALVTALLEGKTMTDAVRFAHAAAAIAVTLPGAQPPYPGAKRSTPSCSSRSKPFGPHERCCPNGGRFNLHRFACDQQ